LPVKPHIVKARIRKIEECVADLQGMRKLQARAFLENRSVRAAAERQFREADGYAEIIDILGEEGVLPKRFAARIRGMAGLRNILVHDYLDVDPAELRKRLGRLKDFERYCRYVVEYLRV